MHFFGGGGGEQMSLEPSVEDGEWFRCPDR